MTTASTNAGLALGTMSRIQSAASRFASRAPWVATLVLLALLAFSAPAAADLPSTPPPVAASAPAPAPAASGDGSQSAGAAQNSTPSTEPVVTPRSNRWLYTALLVSGFMVFAGVVGANDKPEGDAKPKSQKPPIPQG